MLDCKKLNKEENNNEASKKAPLPTNTSTIPNQLKIREVWQGKKKSSSNPSQWSKFLGSYHFHIPQLKE